MTKPFEARLSKPKVVLYLAISLMFLALTYWVIFDYTPSSTSKLDSFKQSIFTYLSPILAGLMLYCTVKFSKMLFDNSVWLSINKDGLMWKSVSDKIIPWDQIAGLREKTIKHNKFIEVVLKNSDLFTNKGGVLGFLAKLEKQKSFLLNAGVLNCTREEVFDAVTSHWLKYQEFVTSAGSENKFNGLEF